MRDISIIERMIKDNKKIINDIFGKISIIDVLNNSINIIDENNIEYKVYLDDNSIVFINGNPDNFHKYVMDIGNEDKSIKEHYIEKRDDGYLVERIKRNYGESFKLKTKNSLTDIFSMSYIIKSEQIIPLSNLLDESFLCNNSIKTDVFESRTKKYYENPRNKKYYNDSQYSSVTFFNDIDISEIYDTVKGDNKINRIYDLYKGKINSRNICDIKAIGLGLLSRKSFAYQTTACNINDLIGNTISKKVIGNKELIDEALFDMVGYRKKYDSTDINSIIETINYKMSQTDIAKFLIEIKLHLPYEEYEKLDYKAQKELIAKNKTELDKLINNSEYVIVMIGSGENSIFKKVKKGTKYYSNGCIHKAGSKKKEKVNQKDKIRKLIKRD